MSVTVAALLGENGGGGSDGGDGGGGEGEGGGGEGGGGGGGAQTASVYLSHRRVTPDSMHVLHAVHGVRPVELQVDPGLQLVAASTMVNPKRPCEDREGRCERGKA